MMVILVVVISGDSGSDGDINSSDGDINSSD